MSNPYDTIIYLDAAATTKCADDVVAAMIELSSNHYGNPSSPHTMGRYARRAIVEATLSISRLLGCTSEELTLTSGATESNNIVVLGIAEPDRGQNIVVCPIDHKSILAAASESERRGVEVRLMKVNKHGRIDLDHLAQIVDDNTALVTLAYVNSELGTLQDLSKITHLLKGKSAIFHVDASQAAGKLRLNVQDLKIDCMSLSAHKICGPKGIGALYVSHSSISRLRPLTFGGGQYCLRSGTLPAQLVVGFGLAAKRINSCDLKSQWKEADKRRSIIIETLQQHNIHFKLNSPTDCSVPHILNIYFPGIRSETVIHGLPNVCISSGSACNSQSMKPSYVLTQVGHDQERANCSIRISFTSDMEIDQLTQGAKLIAEKVFSLQQLKAWS
ncbi:MULTISPECIES: cysteine desulfurase family protein [unclassified Pseudomonas]|uniref:cysteine desulfurase family protein n=1 Tax=unclassified Pseudomonas TaxID=196821 RepID=UPI0030DD5327